MTDGIEDTCGGTKWAYNARHSTLQYPGRTLKIENITGFDFSLIKMLDDIQL